MPRFTISDQIAVCNDHLSLTLDGERERRAFRPLEDDEIAVLRRNRNVGLFKVSRNAGNLRLALEGVRDCRFVGDDVRFLFRGDEFRGTLDLCRSEFENVLFVTEMGRRVTVVVMETSVTCAILFSPVFIKRCGPIHCDAKALKMTTSFGNGTVEISPGLESGGRSIPCTCEMSLETCSKASYDINDVHAFRAGVKDSVARMIPIKPVTIICEGAILESAVEVNNSVIGPRSSVRGGSHVECSTLMEDVSVDTGANVFHSLLQAHTRVETRAVVRNSLLCERAHAELQALCLSSILGRNTGVAEAEVTSSLVGPCVGLHHHSLLIAAYWPAGRGNVGYGANCGSNHTSKAPDQSLWPGEGVFFGLGSSLKFPLNLSEAPYSVVATGVVYGPGRLTLPFSLVTALTAGMGDASVRVSPGWVFEANTYMLERSAVKLAGRVDTRVYAVEPMRAATMSLVWAALNTLRDAPAQKPLRSFVQTAEGIVLASDVARAVRTYTQMLDLYALRTVCIGTHALSSEKEVVQRFSLSSAVIIRSHDVTDTGLLTSEAEWGLPLALAWLSHRSREGVAWISTPKARLIELETEYCERVVGSKRRDASKGSLVFPPGKYAEFAASLSPENDAVVRNAMRRVENARSAFVLKGSNL